MVLYWICLTLWIPQFMPILFGKIWKDHGPSPAMGRYVDGLLTVTLVIMMIVIDHQSIYTMGPWLQRLLQSGGFSPTGWWFGCHFLFLHILGRIIPNDVHIFQRDWNHQPAKNLWQHRWRFLAGNLIDLWWACPASQLWLPCVFLATDSDSPHGYLLWWSFY